MRFVVIVMLSLAGCYNPQIGEGKFLCGPANSCPAGFSCASDNRCYRMAPTPDMTSTAFVGNGALGDLDLSAQTGVVLFNGKTGVFKLAAAPNTVLVGPGVSTDFAAGFQMQVTQPSGGPPVSIWNFGKVVIPSGVILQSDPAGGAGYAIAFLATGQLTLQGAIDVRGLGGFGGLPGKAGKDPSSSLMTGGGGGATAEGSGGGGAGHKDAGKAGDGPSGGIAGTAYGNDDLTVLVVGSGGGGGGTPTSTGSRGGTGGGGIALISAVLDIAGKIDVTGANGEAGDSNAPTSAGGGGAGAGGAILLGGNSVTLESSHTLLALGGGAGVGSSGGSSGGIASKGRITVIGTVVTNGGTGNDMPVPTIKTNSLIATFPR